MLDLGAHGVMIPRIDLPAQAAEVISFMRYPPDGTRGLALSTRGAGLGELGHADVQAINRRVVGIIQIESPSAVEHARGHRRDRRRRRAVRRPGRPVATAWAFPASSTIRASSPRWSTVVAAADAAGKAAGILLFNMAVVSRHRELGFRFIGLGSDGSFVADGARSVLAHARG